MNVNLLIRRANADDIEELVGLLKTLFSIESDFTFDEGKQRNGLNMMLENEEFRCINVAEIKKKVVGMCTAQLLISTAEGGLVALVEDMVIHENYRQQGIGQLLLSSIEEWSISHGARRLELLADQKNGTALKFYEDMKWYKTQLICLHKKQRGHE